MSYTRSISTVLLAAFLGLVTYGQIVRGQTRIPGPGGTAPSSAVVITHIQTCCSGSGSTWDNGTGGTTSAITTTTGNLVVATCTEWVNAGIQNIAFSDSKSNTWNENPSSPSNPGAKARTHQFYAVLTSGGSSHTFTTSTGASGTYIWCGISEFSSSSGWPATASVFDKSQVNAGATSSGNTATSNSTATRSQASELLVGTVGTDLGAATTWSAGNFFTLPTNGSQGSTSHGEGATDYRFVTAISNDACTFGTTATITYSAICGTYKTQ